MGISMAIGVRLLRTISTAMMALPIFLSMLTVSAAASEKVLHKFLGGNDGLDPQSGLIVDNARNFYGTTAGGGNGTGCQGLSDQGCGTVYKITPKGKESVLYAFAGGCDGALPFGTLLIGNQGFIYGTTSYGGICGNDGGYGTVFELTSGGGEKNLYAFQGTTDGAFPSGNLLSDANGNLFGTTQSGGDMNVTECDNFGCGTVFEVGPSGDESVIYAFASGTDGAEPRGGLISDASGNFYGTTFVGGSPNCPSGCGTVFEVSPKGAETILYKFQGGSDGELPSGGVTADAAGNLYGTTSFGGSGGEGTVFKLSSGGTETVLYSFKDGHDGAVPFAGVILDGAGNIYGTTYAGGGIACHGAGGCGTVWKLTPKGQETVLCALHQRRGRNPTTPLLLDGNGALYGTALFGGTHNNGVVFRIKP